MICRGARACLGRTSGSSPPPRTRRRPHARTEQPEPPLARRRAARAASGPPRRPRRARGARVRSMRPRYAACILIAAASASRRRLGFIAAKFSSFSVTPRARASAALTSPRSFSTPPACATQSAITVSSAFATSRDVFLRSGLGRTHAAASAITSFAVSAGQPAATAGAQQRRRTAGGLGVAAATDRSARARAVRRLPRHGHAKTPRWR